jgi:hypothetical protein
MKPLARHGQAHKNQTVELLSDPSHDFDEKGPFYRCGNGNYPRQIFVDPAPCYHHDVALVKAKLVELRRVAPLPLPLTVYLLSHEETSRCNGAYTDDYVYGDDKTQVEIGGKKRYPPTGWIVLSGKRIPIMPAMTRYLIAHEYGHAVEHWLGKVRHGEDRMNTWYRKHVRPEAEHGYGCGRWHKNIGEVFANDFRILVAKAEPEFWPHPYPRPEKSPKVRAFWRKVAKELGWV